MADQTPKIEDLSTLSKKQKETQQLDKIVKATLIVSTVLFLVFLFVNDSVNYAFIFSVVLSIILIVRNKKELERIQSEIDKLTS